MPVQSTRTTQQLNEPRIRGYSPEAYHTENNSRSRHGEMPGLVPHKCGSFPVKPEGGKRGRNIGTQTGP